ncbi:tetratricopeptide repeat protein [bacterium]|nr:tetratricopeptide repeat protein [bacterium]MBP9810336.1 tetratricopeptide repeat protein [bacterium]
MPTNIDEPYLAIEEFNHASALNPQWSRPYFMLAQLYKDNGNSPKALDYFEKCLQYEKTWLGPYMLQADIWLEIHNYQRAIENYDQAIALTQSPDAFLYSFRAEVKLASGDTLGAVADLTYYLMHDPMQAIVFTIELLLLFNIQIMALALGRNALKRKLLMYE